MQTSVEQLPNHLQKNGLRQVYLVTGDEPLQTMEAADRIRAFARQAGAERTLIAYEKGFDWGQLLQESASMGLFSSAKLLELRMAHHALGKPGSEALIEYLEAAPPENALLVTMDKIDKRSQQAKWFKAIDKMGVVIQIRSPTLAKLPEWIGRRCRQNYKSIDPEAAELIAMKTEGNLLATQQEIEKLCLLIDSDRISLEDVQNNVTDSSRYDVFALIEYALDGKGHRAINMLRGLRQEGTEPISIYGAIMWELRRIMSISGQISAGVPRETVFNQHRVWYSRQAAINSLLNRLNRQHLSSLLQEAIYIDRSLKGAARNNPWELMERLIFSLGGTRLVPHANNGLN
jgi:DNA polymerase-3 subunit delta